MGPLLWGSDILSTPPTPPPNPSSLLRAEGRPRKGLPVLKEFSGHPRGTPHVPPFHPPDPPPPAPNAAPDGLAPGPQPPAIAIPTEAHNSHWEGGASGSSVPEYLPWLLPSLQA